MPGMPRFSLLGTKIAYKILGTPPNIKFKPTSQEKKVQKRIVFEDTARVR